jgi:tetratricopeptide (TPR) repeat protein
MQAGLSPLESQNDSLVRAAENEKNDSVKFAMYYKIAKSYVMKDQDKADEFINKAMAVAKKSGSIRDVYAAFRMQGTILYYRNNFSDAIDKYKTAIGLAESIKDNPSGIYRNIALCYTKLGKNSKAADVYFKSLKIAESFNDSLTICNLLNDLGSIFYTQGNYEKARDYYIKAYKAYHDRHEDEGMATELNNIGSTYSSMKDYSFALVYYSKSFEVRQKIQDTLGLITSYGNIAQIHAIRHQFDKALKSDLQSVKLAEASRSEQAMANAYIAIAAIYKDLKDQRNALSFANKALKLIEKLNDMDRIMDIHKVLYEIYDQSDMPAEALKHYKEFLSLKHELNTRENAQLALQLQMQYDFDKKQAADSIQTVETNRLEEERHQQEIRQGKILMYCGVIGFVLMIVVSAVSFRAYRQKRKDNDMISEQKLLVEEKQKEILDSIHYAKRIQLSLLPSEKYFERNLTRLKK